jgi:diphthine-ammonia ligase
MIAALYSGGKDSTLAVHKMWENGVRTDLLISMVSENEFSYMFHRPNIKWTSMQAEAMGIRHVFRSTKGEKEKELIDIEDALVQNRVTELITGAVASRYQADRINDICKKLAIKHHAPLWGIEPLAELNELASRFDVIVTQVSAEGFDNNILGKRIDEHMIQRLVELHRKYRINMLFEGGEAESFVRDAPLFKKRIEVKMARTEWSGPVGRYIIEDAELHNK